MIIKKLVNYKTCSSNYAYKRNDSNGLGLQYKKDGHLRKVGMEVDEAVDDDKDIDDAAVDAVAAATAPVIGSF